MNTENSADWQKRLEIPGRVSFLEGQGDLSVINVNTEWSTAEIFLHGGHVAQFQKRNEPPLLFLSQFSRYDQGHSIRGGIPIILPWFGARDGQPSHGYARIKDWDLKEICSSVNGGTSLRFQLPDYPEAGSPMPFSADYLVTVSDTLELQLVVTNKSSEENLVFENCLHTYFAVGDIAAVTIAGLKGAVYEDKVEDFAQKTEADDVIRVGSEVDRVYLDTTAPVEILDPSLGRKIRVEKDGSASTVVWNPWIAKARQMPDFGNDEYLQMVCVESGNVARNKLILPPGKTSVLTVRLSSAPLG